MKIVLAPHIPILTHGSLYDKAFINLCLDKKLPGYILILVPEKWAEVLAGSQAVASSYELFKLLLELPVIEIRPVRKANYINLNPDILSEYKEEETKIAKQQLFALSSYLDAKRIYAGSHYPTGIVNLSYDNVTVPFINFNPYGLTNLIDLLNTFTPKLEQLKHYQKARRERGKVISPFSAYEKQDETYAQSLLQKAYEDYNGDVDDRTYLYTWDKKNKTFVQFRPDRNNVYHGMDIDLKTAKEKAPDIVRKYHK